jgi:hypothetical protein
MVISRKCRYQEKNYVNFCDLQHISLMHATTSETSRYQYVLLNYYSNTSHAMTMRVTLEWQEFNM